METIRCPHCGQVLLPGETGHTCEQSISERREIPESVILTAILLASLAAVMVALFMN